MSKIECTKAEFENKRNIVDAISEEINKEAYAEVSGLGAFNAILVIELLKLEVVSEELVNHVCQKAQAYFRR